MTYDVVVVGGGIGGLTVAALLASRGLNVCLFERQSQVGGCVARVEFSNYEFDPGMGLYTSFGEGEIYEQFFDELKLPPPKTTRIESEYVVRLTGDADVRLFREKEELNAELACVFSECRSSATEFYKRIQEINDLRSLQTSEIQETRGVIANLFRRRAGNPVGEQLARAKSEPIKNLLTDASPRFRRFIVAQLRSFIQTGVEVCDSFSAALALGQPFRQAYEIEGGPAVLAERLSAAIKSAGGEVRLNTSVLRVAWNNEGHAVGVDLLSGETVQATKAIVSNMTVWDTYGKLIGLNRTPPELKTKLSGVSSAGVYLIYAAVDQSGLSRLPSQNFLVAEDPSDEFTFTTRTSAGSTNHAATIKTNCEVEPWFAYQANEEVAEERDQEMLEKLWARVHRALPELRDSIEVIETMNPRIYYDQTRRKLGKVMGFEHVSGMDKIGQSTIYPNLFMVGDTTSPLPTLDSLIESSIALANRLTK